VSWICPRLSRPKRATEYVRAFGMPGWAVLRNPIGANARRAVRRGAVARGVCAHGAIQWRVVPIRERNTDS
jgi:hypothetical protein